MHTAPMYFLALEIENVKCFGKKQRLDLSDDRGSPARWTLLLGDNGVGKTTLLQMLAWMRPSEEPKEEIREKFSPHIPVKPVLDDIEDNTEYDRLYRVGATSNAVVTATLTVGRSLDGGGQNDSEEMTHGMSIKVKGGKLDEVTPTHGSLKEFNEPNLFAYGANRHMARKNADQAELSDPVGNLFSDTADLYDAEQVLGQLHYRALIEESESKTPGESNTRELLNKILQLLTDLLPDLSDANSIEIKGPSTLGSDSIDAGVVVHMPYGPVPLSALSLGYKTTLAWAVDLALRLYRQNPESDAPLLEPAVVLVDEIDLHLHPKWQRDIRRYLTRHFPNTQFICTAHSPIVAQSAETENLAVLDRIDGEARIDNVLSIERGQRIDQILVTLFRLPSARSAEVAELVNERRRLLQKLKRTKGEDMRLAELDEFLAALPTEERDTDQKAIDLIRRAAAVLSESD